MDSHHRGESGNSALSSANGKIHAGPSGNLLAAISCQWFCPATDLHGDHPHFLQPSISHRQQRRINNLFSLAMVLCLYRVSTMQELISHHLLLTCTNHKSSRVPKTWKNPDRRRLQGIASRQNGSCGGTGPKTNDIKNKRNKSTNSLSTAENKGQKFQSMAFSFPFLRSPSEFPAL